MGGAMRMRWLTGAVVLLLCPVVLLSAQSRSGGCEKGLTPDDVKAIKATIEAYRTSWLKGDSKGVLNSFAEDAVLLPHHGDPPVQGIAAIQNYLVRDRRPTHNHHRAQDHRRTGWRQ